MQEIVKSFQREVAKYIDLFLELIAQKIYNQTLLKNFTATKIISK